MHTQLTNYTRNVTETRGYIEGFQNNQDYISNALDVAGLVVASVRKFKNVTNKTEQGFETTEVILEILGFVSPLKTPVNLMKKVIDRAEKPVEKVNEKLDTLSNKDDKKTPEKEEKDGFITALDKAIGNAGLVNDAMADLMTGTHFQLSRAIEATTNFKPALTAALKISTAPGAVSPWFGLNGDVEDEFKLINPDYESINALMRSIQADFNAFIGIFKSIDFSRIYDSIVGMDAIEAILKVLETPLEIARGVIEPIKPLLNAIDALVGLIVNPIIDYVTKTLGVDKLIDEVADFIQSLLPPIDLLDKLLELAQGLKDKVEEYITTEFQQELLKDDISTKMLLNGGLASPDTGPTGWGSFLPDNLLGGSDDNIIDGLGGVDLINAGAGNDIIIAGEGSDVIDGQAGADLIYFGYSFAEYGIARYEQDNDDVENDFIFTHLLPKNPDLSTGKDIIRNLEDADYVVFTDITFTGQELLNAIIGPSVLTGDINYDGTQESYNDLMFLEVDGDSSINIAYGLQGDDRIFGTIERDRLFGGSGNDTLLPGYNNDEVFGGTGIDTYQVLAGVDKSLKIDLRAGTVDGEEFSVTRDIFGNITGVSGYGDDTLDSIENLVIGPNKPQEIIGNNQANTIITGDGGDIISALDGDDLIEVNGGPEDIVIAGNGSDTVKGGEGRDFMISGSRAVAGVSDHYEGGSDGEYAFSESMDVVSYSQYLNYIRNIGGEIDFTLQSRFGQFIQDYDESERVVIHGDTGTIDRIDSRGRVITTDTTEGVEGFIGSDQGDILHGGDLAVALHGAGGNDKIFINSTREVYGGADDDRFVVTEKQPGLVPLYIYGGTGYDRVDLTPIDDVRWYFEDRGDTSRALDAFQTTVTQANLGSSGNRPPTVTGIELKDIEEVTFGNFNDHFVYSATGTGANRYNLLDGNDLIEVKNGFTEVFAGAGNDVAEFIKGDGRLHAGDGDDIARFKNAGDDEFAYMGRGDDYLWVDQFKGDAQGGEGFDTLAFNTSTSGVRVNMFEGTATGDGFDMTLSGFEEVIGTGNVDWITGTANSDTITGRSGNDRLEGWAADDKLYGGDGEDVIFGGAGDDLLHGGSNDDTLNGGSGLDTASYAWLAPDNLDGSLRADNFGGVTVDLSTGTATGSHGTDELNDIENVFGSNGNDELHGDNGENSLTGEKGDDQLFGHGGNDVLVTGEGNDRAFGGEGDDTVVIGIGNKVLDGGAGEDTLDFGTVTGTVYLDIDNGSYTAEFEDSRPIWLDAEVMTDEMGERSWAGGTFSPQEVWEARNPFQINGSEDVNRNLPDEDHPDYNTFLFREEKVIVSSSGTFTGFEKITGGINGVNIVITSGFERYDGTDITRDLLDLSLTTDDVFYNFQTDRSSRIDILDGDIVSGFEGMQTGAGNDRLIGDGRDNILRGGAGEDFIRASAGKDELGGDQGEDFLYGGFGDDIVRGGEDNDTVAGDEGDDTLFGDDGEDVLVGGAGNDDLNGGAGRDTASYQAARGGVEIDLRITDRITIGSGQGADLLTSIENLQGSAFRDWLSGNDDENTLWGGAGRDTLWGQEGNDKLRGGDGADSVRGGQGDDDMRGDAGNDYLTGNRGDDMLDGGAGDDTLVGNSGFDTACYVFATSGVYVDLRHSGRDVGGGQGRDTFESVENILGSSHADRLVGTSGANTLTAGNGNDVVKGKGGNDTVYGNKGNDRLVTAEGDDIIYGGDDDDILIGLGGNDSLYGEDGDDFLYGGRGGDVMYGGKGNDVLRGNRDEDEMFGGQGNDDLRGGGGDDDMIGNRGDDFLFGNNGADTINGGWGNDVMRGGTSGSGGDGFRDVFVFETNSGVDAIRDFENGLDRIDVSDYGFASFAELRTMSESRASGLKIDFGDGNEVFIDGMSLFLFSADDVIL